MNMGKSLNFTLPVPLSTEEKVLYGRQLADMHAEYVLVEIRKKASADTFKSELEQLDARMSHLSAVVRAGEELRSVECQWRYLFESDTKELIRMDTGEIIETQPITPAERQLMLQMEQEKETSEA